jgi:hypothetical protein
MGVGQLWYNKIVQRICIGFFFLIIKNIYASRYFRNSLGNQVACEELNLNFIKIYVHYSTSYLQKQKKLEKGDLPNRCQLVAFKNIWILQSTHNFFLLKQFQI